MSRSQKKSTLAVLRGVMGITAKQMAIRLGCGPDSIKSIEINRADLGEERAQKLFHDTGISLSWLLANDPNVPPVTSTGERYTHERFVQYKAKKKQFFDEQDPWFRLNNAIGFCAHLYAILESANAQKKYYMAAYKASEAIEALQKEFGQDLGLYPVINPNVVAFQPALEILGRLLDHGQKEVAESNRRLAALTKSQKKSGAKRPSKRSSSRRRARA